MILTAVLIVVWFSPAAASSRSRGGFGVKFLEVLGAQTGLGRYNTLQVVLYLAKRNLFRDKNDRHGSELFYC